MATTMDRKMYEYAVVRVSWGSSFGTIAIYLLAPLVLSFSGWRTVFLVCGAIGVGMSILWFFMARYINYAPAEEEITSDASPRKKKRGLGGQFFLPIALIMLSIALQGMIRDGVTAWMPTYLSEVFAMQNSVSILSTVSLAIFSIVSFWAVGLMFDRFFKSEVFCAAIMFGLAALTAGVFYLFYDAGAILAILLMTLMTGLMHGVNLVLTGYVPKHFRNVGKVSTVSGLLNSCTYVGASISTYGVARIAEVMGWRFNILVWLIVTAVGCVVCLCAVRPWKRAEASMHMEE
jgi:OPA family glycerol-3-phosphate transporter-like MFS transporter